MSGDVHVMGVGRMHMLQLAFLQSIGPTEWILVFLVVLLLFGATRIPKIARSLGKSATEFKKGLREGGNEEETKKDDDSSDKS